MKRLMLICLAMFLVTLGMSVMAYAAKPGDCFSTQVIDLSCSVVECPDDGEDCVCCNWTTVGADKYSVDFDVTVDDTDGDNTGTAGEDYIIEMSFGTSEWNEENMAAGEICVPLTEFAPSDPDDESISAVAKVKGLVNKEGNRCRQKNENSWSASYGPFDLVD